MRTFYKCDNSIIYCYEKTYTQAHTNTHIPKLVKIRNSSPFTFNPHVFISAKKGEFVY